MASQTFPVNVVGLNIGLFKGREGSFLKVGVKRPLGPHTHAIIVITFCRKESSKWDIS